MSVQELQSHHSENHREGSTISSVGEFALLKVDVHYEHTVLKIYFTLKWVPFFWQYAKELGFRTVRDLRFVLFASDQHLVWELFGVSSMALLREIAFGFVRECISMKHTSADHHGSWNPGILRGKSLSERFTKKQNVNDLS